MYLRSVIAFNLETKRFPMTAHGRAELPDPLLISAKDAARMLSISTRYLYDVTASGDLNCIQIGTRKKLYERAEIERFITARRRPPKTKPAA